MSTDAMIPPSADVILRLHQTIAALDAATIISAKKFPHAELIKHLPYVYSHMHDVLPSKNKYRGSGDTEIFIYYKMGSDTPHKLKLEFTGERTAGDDICFSYYKEYPQWRGAIGPSAIDKLNETSARISDIESTMDNLAQRMDRIELQSGVVERPNSIAPTLASISPLASPSLPLSPPQAYQLTTATVPTYQVVLPDSPFPELLLQKWIIAALIEKSPLTAREIMHAIKKNNPATKDMTQTPINKSGNFIQSPTAPPTFALNLAGLVPR